jgi:hypothetical protein
MMAKLMGMGGLQNMGHKFPGKSDPDKKEQGEVRGEGGEHQTVITHHPDGTHTVKTHDGEEQHHPTHLHAGAHLLHHMSGGDKHHIAHHDGMGIATHGIHEDGQHEGPTDHNSAEEAADAMSKFLGEEAQEPEHQGVGASTGHDGYGGM